LPFHPRRFGYTRGWIMPHPSENAAHLFVWAAAATWPLLLVVGWMLKRRWARRYERMGESTSEEMLAELAGAYAPRRTIRIHTPTEYLPFVLESIREVVDSGFDDKQMLSLLQRVEIHRPHDERRAVFPVEVGGRRTDLLFVWSRDAADRMRLGITAAPTIIRALRVQ